MSCRQGPARVRGEGGTQNQTGVLVVGVGGTVQEVEPMQHQCKLVAMELLMVGKPMEVRLSMSISTVHACVFGIQCMPQALFLKQVLNIDVEMKCHIFLCQSCALIAVLSPDVMPQRAVLSGRIWGFATSVVWQSLLPVWSIAAPLEMTLHFCAGML